MTCIYVCDIVDSDKYCGMMIYLFRFVSMCQKFLVYMYVYLKKSRKIDVKTRRQNIISNFDYQNRLRTKDFAGDCNLINLYNLRIKKC